MKNSVNLSLRFLFIVIVGILSVSQIHGESRLGYTGEFQLGLSYTTKSTDVGQLGIPSTTSGPAADVRFNFSTIGLLFFKESSFMVGDHLGIGIGGGYISRTNANEKSTFMMPVSFEGGLKAAYAINDDLEVGIKWIYIGANQFMDYKNDFYVGAKNVFAANARYKDLMLSLGLGTATLADNPKLSKSDAATGTYLMAEGRYFFGNKYILARAEIYSGKVELTSYTRNDTGSQFTVGFGMM